MDRRKSIKTIILGTGAIGLGLQSCKTESEEALLDQEIAVAEKYFGRTPEELERIEEINEEQLFNEHELETIAVLSEVILPPKDPFGGPIEADVPNFIEFVGKDMPKLQNTLLGGLMWLDHESISAFGTEFKSTPIEQQKTLLDPIAYYDPEIPMKEQSLGIQFFSLMRNLTLTGYYTSKIGIQELGYKGNTPNVWDGVPQDVLDQHGMAYDPEWIAMCIDQSTRADIATWDDEGNLLT